MDDESQELIRGMVYLLEQAYIDVHAYWTIVTGLSPDLMPSVERLQKDAQHRADARVRFQSAYDAVQERLPSRVREILKTILGEMDSAKPN